MSKEAVFSVSLRLWHPAISADAIITAVGLEPEFAHSVGTARVSPSGQSLEGVYRETYCCFPLAEKVPGVFTDLLPHLLLDAEVRRDFFKSVNVDGGRSELYVVVFTESSTGFTLDEHCISAMANLSLALSVEVYY